MRAPDGREIIFSQPLAVESINVSQAPTEWLNSLLRNLNEQIAFYKKASMPTEVNHEFARKRLEELRASKEKILSQIQTMPPIQSPFARLSAGQPSSAPSGFTALSASWNPTVYSSAHKTSHQSYGNGNLARQSADPWERRGNEQMGRNTVERRNTNEHVDTPMVAKSAVQRVGEVAGQTIGQPAGRMIGMLGSVPNVPTLPNREIYPGAFARESFESGSSTGYFSASDSSIKDPLSQSLLLQNKDGKIVRNVFNQRLNKLSNSGRISGPISAGLGRPEAVAIGRNLAREFELGAEPKTQILASSQSLEDFFTRSQAVSINAETSRRLRLDPGKSTQEIVEEDGGSLKYSLTPNSTCFRRVPSDHDLGSMNVSRKGSEAEFFSKGLVEEFISHHR